MEVRRGTAAWWAIAAFGSLAMWLFAGAIGYTEPATRGASEPPTAVPDDTASPPVPPPPAELPIAAAPARDVSRAIGNADRVDPSWTSAVSARTGIPVRALAGYGGVELAIAIEAPGCRLEWSTLAALGRIESGHGTHNGSTIDETGTARPAILGPDLDGDEFDRIDDTDDGAVDGSATIDRAAGPMQFIPSTWQSWGADGSGDGAVDPQQIDDASLAAGRYLCSYGDLSDTATWRRAILAYNHVESYADAVAEAARAYAELARG